MLLTAQYSDNEYPVQVAGPPLILQGYIPAGAPGGAWPNVRIGAGAQPLRQASRDDIKNIERFRLNL